jgi:hypothetical protein
VGSIRLRNGNADAAAPVPFAPEQSVNLAAYGARGLNLPMKWNLSVIRLSIASR